MAEVVKVVQLKEPGTDVPVAPVTTVDALYNKNGDKVDNLLSYTLLGSESTIPEITKDVEVIIGAHTQSAETITSGTLSADRLPTIPGDKLPNIPSYKLPTIEIPKGGTGGTTQGEARENLSVYSKAEVDVMFIKNRADIREHVVGSSVNVNAGDVVDINSNIISKNMVSPGPVAGTMTGSEMISELYGVSISDETSTGSSSISLRKAVTPLGLNPATVDTKSLSWGTTYVTSIGIAAKSRNGFIVYATLSNSSWSSRGAVLYYITIVNDKLVVGPMKTLTTTGISESYVPASCNFYRFDDTHIMHTFYGGSSVTLKYQLLTIGTDNSISTSAITDITNVTGSDVNWARTSYSQFRYCKLSNYKFMMLISSSRETADAETRSSFFIVTVDTNYKSPLFRGSTSCLWFGTNFIKLSETKILATYSSDFVKDSPGTYTEAKASLINIAEDGNSGVITITHSDAITFPRYTVTTGGSYGWPTRSVVPIRSNGKIYGCFFTPNAVSTDTVVPLKVVEIDTSGATPVLGTEAILISSGYTGINNGSMKAEMVTNCSWWNLLEADSNVAYVIIYNGGIFAIEAYGGTVSGLYTNMSSEAIALEAGIDGDTVKCIYSGIADVYSGITNAMSWVKDGLIISSAGVSAYSDTDYVLHVTSAASVPWVTGSFTDPTGAGGTASINLGFRPKLVLCYTSTNQVSAVAQSNGAAVVAKQSQIIRILSDAIFTDAGKIANNGFTFQFIQGGVSPVYYIAYK